MCARCLREGPEALALTARDPFPTREDLLSEVRRALVPRHEHGLASGLVAYLDTILPPGRLPAPERRPCLGCGADREGYAGADAAVCLECLRALGRVLPPESEDPPP